MLVLADNGATDAHGLVVHRNFNGLSTPRSTGQVCLDLGLEYLHGSAGSVELPDGALEPTRIFHVAHPEKLTG